MHGYYEVDMEELVP